MKIYFSNNDMLMNFNHFLSQVDFKDNKELEIITANNWISVHPAALVLAAALAKKVGKNHTIIDNSAGESGLYLDRMGLYDYSKTESPYKYNQHDESGRFIPIRQILTQSDQSRFVTDIIPLLHLDPEKSQMIRYVIGELVRNVLEHSMSNDGAFVAAQYRPKTNVLSFGVCDTGIGIRKSLEKFHFSEDNLSAIRLALMPGISGTTAGLNFTEDNGGAGLFIVKNLSKMTRNYFILYSGDAAYKLLKYDKRIKGLPKIKSDPLEDKHSAYSDLPKFDGTLVGVDIALDDTETFNTIMEVIKVGYSKSIRERKERKYKEIKFV
ncbi:sensor histidine kinase [Candidatus Saccharibacteria bacterium]|nr:sensor histidine kinase [Candidatus Saccharibacteria bacterium]